MRAPNGLVTALLLAAIAGRAAGQDAPRSDPEIAALLLPLRAKNDVPALAGAIVTTKGLQGMAAVGVRKRGSPDAVGPADRWHLGSDTKAMTAVLLAVLVEQKQLTWSTTLAEVFPQEPMPPALREVTVAHLLSHQAGFPANLAAAWGVDRRRPMREQRLAVLRAALADPAHRPPGTYLYSNTGYMVAGTVAEARGGAAWEELLQRLVCVPLAMKDVGFGGMGTPGKIDQPWGHLATGAPVGGNGPAWDNPPVMGPAGTLHCTLSDWASFVADQLRGRAGEKALLSSPAAYQFLHTPLFGGQYALGWGAARRDWGGGTVLTHAGSNTMHYAVVWMAPAKGFAVLAVSNQGGERAARACDDAAGALIGRHLKSK